MLGKTNWLRNLYQKKKLDPQMIQTNIKRHEEHLNKFKELISKLGKKNSNRDDYMKRFADERQKLYMPWKVTMLSYEVDSNSKIKKWLA